MFRLVVNFQEIHKMHLKLYQILFFTYLFYDYEDTLDLIRLQDHENETSPNTALYLQQINDS